MNISDEAAYPALTKIIDQVLLFWPEHERYLRDSFGKRDPSEMRHAERLSRMMLSLAAITAGGLPKLVEDYRFLCEEVVFPEELHFRRTGSYRLTQFEEAQRTVYSNASYMNRYMNGLLVSDVLWINHAQGLQHYAENFLASLPAGAKLLEIGPGHGLLLFLATQAANVGEITAWDVSQTSLDMSKHALETLQAKRPVKFEMRNIFDDAIMAPANSALFDGIVLSEVLEHLEEPERAIRVLLHLCKPGGRIWLNVPANSPAPDHLFLVNEPLELENLVRKTGLKIVDTAYFPMVGATLARAIKQKLTITCIIVAERTAHS